MPRILIIDDDHALRETIAETLADLGHEVVEAGSGEEARARLAERRADAILLDLRMPGEDGIAVLRYLRDGPDPPPVTILTAIPTAANTIEAMRLGAFDHLAKPISRDALADIVRRMLLRPKSRAPSPAMEGLIGTGEAMRTVQKSVGLLADSDAMVLLTGETGTGKEVVARAIHAYGRRAARPFVALNCAAIPSELLESELFGHVRGAFTGAIADRTGAFREAQGGTLLLDEIGDMGLAMQGKLLRALQERVVTPVGGKPVRIDVRIVAATHRDLPGEVAAGRFREDLFYRLSIVPLHLPPLRERLSDIVPLAEHFLAEAVPARRLSADAAARLLSHPWPGNVRELRNAMARAAVMTRHATVAAADLGFLAGQPAPATQAADLPGAVAQLEAAMIQAALDRHGGNRARAARELGIHRPMLYAKMRRYGIEVSESHTPSVLDQDSPEDRVK